MVELDPERRRVLAYLGSGLSAALIGISGVAQAVTPRQQISVEAARRFWNEPRVLWLNRPAAKQQLRLVYWQQGRLVPQVYQQLCGLLRDVRANRTAAIDVRLLDILYGCQRWLQMSGIEAPLQITSGYRTAETNAGIEGAALQSLHQYGRAADFYVSGVGVDQLATMARYFNGGGVGLYLRQGFVHVDSGRPRYWRG